jgi:cbb3-type cytochrome oxidase subunit 3
MFSQSLSSIEGVWIFPIIGLVIFFTFFSAIIYWVVKEDKSYMEILANIPLEEKNEVELNEESKNEK